MNYTTNYHLKKPSYTDAANIADINDNMEIIDNQLKIKRDIVAPTNYSSAIATISGLALTGNSQQVTKNQDGLVTVNISMVTTNGAKAISGKFITLPADVRPTGNVLLHMLINVDEMHGCYINATDGGIYAVGSKTVSGELSITGSYYV